MSRFDVDCFVKPPDHELICCICQFVLDQPVESPCRHVFCRICVTRWLDTKDSCPTCRHSPLLEAHLKPALPLIQNMINKLEIRCKNFTNGCPVQFVVEFFDQFHQDNCDYRFIRCKYKKCQREILAKHEAKHDSECDWKEIQCNKQCGLHILAKDLITHNCVESLRNMVADLMKTVENLKTEVLDLRMQLSQVEERNNNTVNDDYSDFMDDYDDYFQNDDDLTSFSGNEEEDNVADEFATNEIERNIENLFGNGDDDGDNDAWANPDENDVRSGNDENSSDILAESDIDYRDNDDVNEDARSDSLAGFSDSPLPSPSFLGRSPSEYASPRNDASDNGISVQSYVSDYNGSTRHNGSDDESGQNDLSENASLQNNDNYQDPGYLYSPSEYDSNQERSPVRSDTRYEAENDSDSCGFSSYRSKTRYSPDSAVNLMCSPSLRSESDDSQSASEKRDWRREKSHESPEHAAIKHSPVLSNPAEARKRKLSPTPPLSPSIPSTSGTCPQNNTPDQNRFDWSSSDDNLNHISKPRKRRKKGSKKSAKKRNQSSPIEGSDQNNEHNSTRSANLRQDYLTSWVQDTHRQSATVTSSTTAVDIDILHRSSSGYQTRSSHNSSNSSHNTRSTKQKHHK
ncbi:uncharacterized protein LOC141904589 [Tubulanus polymorphus]|uniref:uncharacterized protein LOC141904589 n=1 Tax=Tubulanus polymorphus TaxID=672921 RepID=UPI003DA5998F